MGLLKQILPKELHNSKIINNKLLPTCYQVKEDNIILNRYEILKNIELVTAICKDVKKDMNKREIIIFTLLHELGHKYYIGIKKDFNFNRYITEKKKLLNKYTTDNCNNIEIKIKNWKEVSDERKAQKFAKDYFLKYLELRKRG